MGFFQLFSKLAHHNSLIFCSKVNLGNTYIFSISIFCRYEYRYDHKWSKIGHSQPKMAQNEGLLNFFLSNYVLIFLTLCLKLYLDTLEHKSWFLLCLSTFLARFWLFRGPQNYTFWLFKSVFWPFLVSRRLADWDLRNHVCPFVRPLSVSFVTRYLRICTSELSEIWHLGRTWIGDKNVPSGFF